MNDFNRGVVEFQKCKEAGVVGVMVAMTMAHLSLQEGRLHTYEEARKVVDLRFSDLDPNIPADVKAKIAYGFKNPGRPLFGDDLTDMLIDADKSFVEMGFQPNKEDSIGLIETAGLVGFFNKNYLGIESDVGEIHQKLLAAQG